MATITRIDRPSSDVDQHVARALCDSPFFAERHPIRFTTQSGHVTLYGTVSSYYQKQMAQEVLRGVQGVVRIENRLEVTWPLEPRTETHHDVCEMARPTEASRGNKQGVEPKLTVTHNEQGSHDYGTRRSRNLQGKSTHASR